MITIVNYGVGNLGAISNMLNYLDIPNQISREANKIAQADRLILPGIGAFDYCVQRLQATGLVDVLQHKALVEQVPVLGICVGMQLMCQASEEGREKGLDWFDAQVRRFQPDQMDVPRPVPHMGWNAVHVRQAHALTQDLPANPRFYFAHSYHAVCASEQQTLLSCAYGYTFAAALVQGNLAAVQFHPEKSHRYGFALLKNFAHWQPQGQAQQHTIASTTEGAC